MVKYPDNPKPQAPLFGRSWVAKSRVISLISMAIILIILIALLLTTHERPSKAKLTFAEAQLLEAFALHRRKAAEEGLEEGACSGSKRLGQGSPRGRHMRSRVGGFGAKLRDL